MLLFKFNELNIYFIFIKGFFFYKTNNNNIYYFFKKYNPY